jgi:hypothetical protein
MALLDFERDSGGDNASEAMPVKQTAVVGVLLDWQRHKRKALTILPPKADCNATERTYPGTRSTSTYHARPRASDDVSDVLNGPLTATNRASFAS